MFLYIFRLRVALFPRSCDNCIACSMGSLKVLTGVNPYGIELPSSPPLDSYLLAESVYFLPPSFLPLKHSVNMSGCFVSATAFHVFIFFPLLLMHWKIFTVDSHISSGGLLTLSSRHLLITVCRPVDIRRIVSYSFPLQCLAPNPPPTYFSTHSQSY